MQKRSYWLIMSLVLLPRCIDYGGKRWLPRLVKPISLYYRLSFVAMCWKMAHVDGRQGKCWRLSVGQTWMLFVSSGGLGARKLFFGVCSKLRFHSFFVD